MPSIASQVCQRGDGEWTGRAHEHVLAPNGLAGQTETVTLQSVDAKFVLAMKIGDLVESG
jgi:hypothetical protein